MSLRNRCDSFGSCRGNAGDAGERSTALLPPALPGERRGPSPPALSPRDVPWAPMSPAAARRPPRPPRLRRYHRLPPVSQRRWDLPPGGASARRLVASVCPLWHSEPQGYRASFAASTPPCAPGSSRGLVTPIPRAMGEHQMLSAALNQGDPGTEGCWAGTGLSTCGDRDGTAWHVWAPSVPGTLRSPRHRAGWDPMREVPTGLGSLLSVFGFTGLEFLL